MLLFYDPDSAEKQGDDVSGLSAVIGGLTNGYTYYVWVKAKNSVGTNGFGLGVSSAAPVLTAGNSQ